MKKPNQYDKKYSYTIGEYTYLDKDKYINALEKFINYLESTQIVDNIHDNKAEDEELCCGGSYIDGTDGTCLNCGSKDNL